MSVEDKFMSLLHWIKTEKLLPKNYHKSDRFVNPLTGRIVLGKDRQTVSNLLWVPTVTGLKHHFPEIKAGRIQSIVTVSDGRHEGFGADESTAVLSYLQCRRQEALVC